MFHPGLAFDIFVAVVTVLVVFSAAANATELRRIGIIHPDHLPSAQHAVEELGINATYQVERIPSTYETMHFDQVSEVHSNLEEKHYIGIIGVLDDVVSLVTEKLNLPYLVTSFVTHTRSNVLRMLPDSTDIASCVFSLVDAYRYQRVGIIFEDQLESLMLSTLIQNPDIDVKLWKVHMREDRDPEEDPEEEIRRSLVSLRRMHIRNILVLSHSGTASRVLAQGRKLGIVAKPFSWIFLNLGSEDFVGDILTDLITNVTVVRFVEQSVSGSADDEESFHGVTALESAMVQDAVAVLVQGYDTWMTNSTNDIVDVMKKVKLTGQSGTVDFNEDGQRNNFSLTIDHYQENNFTRIGEWNRHTIYQNRLLFYESEEAPNLRGQYGRSRLKGTFAKIVTIEEKPWAMRRPDGSMEGYVIDITDRISKMLEFKYELYLVHDGNFGAKLDNGEWNGIMGEILSGNATMSIAPLSINSEREDAVDFTKPFKSRGITVLIRTPEFQSSYFQFMRPFTSLVWAIIIMALLILSLALYLLERYSRACRTDMPKLNATESFWFMFGSIAQGSTESSPVTTPGRILTSAWWFFSLILISTYTANLAAFLTIKKITPPIATVADLTQQSKIRYGTVKNSGVGSFFEKSKIEPFAKMYEQMQLMPDNWVNTTTDGLDMVKEGDYAFLWDNSVNSYVAAHDCDFTEIGPAFDHKGFGVGLPQGSVHTEQLSLAILRLSDEGILSQLEKKWWAAGDCADGGKGGGEETVELELDHVAGMFFVLLAALLVAFCACLIERGLRSKQSPPFLTQQLSTFKPGRDLGTSSL